MGEQAVTDQRRSELATTVNRLLPGLLEDLKRLVRIPSVASPGFPAEPLLAARDLVVELLRDAGVTDIEDLHIKGKTAPVVVTFILEGQEEVGSPFDHYPPTAPELFAADAMVIADVGSVRPGTPTLTVALRGSATVNVEVPSPPGRRPGRRAHRSPKG